MIRQHTCVASQHDPEQQDVPAAHDAPWHGAATQVPRPEQISPAGQTVPQAPQFAVSVWRSRQTVPQQVVPVSQLWPPQPPPLLAPEVEPPPDDEPLPEVEPPPDDEPLPEVEPPPDVELPPEDEPLPELAAPELPPPPDDEPAS